ncbi:MAG: methionyl-tRNA formyltransferase [Veillonellales bacterium]
MSSCRIVFMGTPDFAVPCLDMLVREQYDVIAVVTQPDRPQGRGQKLTASPVKQAALHYNLPVLQPEKIKSPDFEARLALLQPDVIVVVAFGQFLSQTILNLPPWGCINVHASLLPQYRGAAPIHWAVIQGEKYTGVTTMYMDSGMDTGDMILKAEVPIEPENTTGDIHDKLKEVGAAVLKKTLTLIKNRQGPRTPQNSKFASYAPLLTRELERIHWSQSAVSIHNLVRGLNPWPGSFCLFQGKSLKIRQTRLAEPGSSAANHPGRISRLTNAGFVVETGQGFIEILVVQPESKRSMNANDYANGYNITVGDVLE